MPMDDLQRAKVTRRTQRAQATKIWNKAQTLLEGDLDEVKVQQLQVILETYDAKIEQLRKIETIDQLQNSITAPSRYMEVRLVMQSSEFLVYLFRKLKSE